MHLRGDNSRTNKALPKEMSLNASLAKILYQQINFIQITARVDYIFDT